MVKVTDKELHSKSKVIINGVEYRVSENIILEMNIQKYLTDNEQCPDSIVKYLGSFATYV